MKAGGMTTMILILLIGGISSPCFGESLPGLDVPGLLPSGFSHTCPQPSTTYAQVKQIRGAAKEGDYLWGTFTDQNQEWYYAGYHNVSRQSDMRFNKATLYLSGGFLYCAYPSQNILIEIRLDGASLTPGQLSGSFRQATQNTYECTGSVVEDCKFSLP